MNGGNRFLRFGVVLVVFMLAILISAGMTFLQLYVVEPTSPFSYSVGTSAIPAVVCPGESLKIRVVGSSRGFGTQTIMVSHAIEFPDGQTAYRPSMPNTLRFPAAVLAERANFDFVFDTAEFYRQTIGEFPVLDPGQYLYRHQVEIDGYADVGFVVPFEVVNCE